MAHLQSFLETIFYVRWFIEKIITIRLREMRKGDEKRDIFWVHTYTLGLRTLIDRLIKVVVNMNCIFNCNPACIWWHFEVFWVILRLFLPWEFLWPFVHWKWKLIMLNKQNNMSYPSELRSEDSNTKGHLLVECL